MLMLAISKLKLCLLGSLESFGLWFFMIQKAESTEMDPSFEFVSKYNITINGTKDT